MKWTWKDTETAMPYIIIGAFALLLAHCQPGHASDRLEIGWNEFSDGPAGHAYVYSHAIHDDVEDYHAEMSFISIGSVHQLNDNAIAESLVYRDHTTELGAGLAILQHTTPDHLTSAFEFFLTVRCDLTENWGFSYHHMSNAGTAGKNTGEDMFMLDYRF